MRAAALAGVLVIALAAAATWFALPASADFEWGVIESTMPNLCALEAEEEAKEAAAKTQQCITVAESACEATPKGPEQAVLHSEGCDIAKAAASRGSAGPGESESGSGGDDALLIAGLAALILVVVSSAWVAVDGRKRDWSGVSGPKSPAAYAIGVLLLWIIFFPLYLAQRRRAPLREAAQ